MKLALVLGLFAMAAQATVTPSFQQQFETEQVAVNAPVASDLLARTSRYQVLVVGGFFGEFTRNAFRDNIVSLQNDFGIRDFEIFDGASFTTIDANSNEIRLKVLGLHAAHPNEPIILMGQSMGGAGVTAFALKNRDLLESGVVAKVVSVQGAMGGSKMSDSALSPCRISDAASEFCEKHDIFDGLASLRTEVTRAYFAGLVAAIPRDQREFYRDRLFFVRTAIRDPKTTSKILRVPYLIMNRLYGDNDGVLLTQDEFLPELGTTLGVLSADHFDLTIGYGSAQVANFRHAFTRLVMKRLLQDAAF